jgi:hypothetical protein
VRLPPQHALGSFSCCRTVVIFCTVDTPNLPDRSAPSLRQVGWNRLRCRCAKSSPWCTATWRRAEQPRGRPARAPTRPPKTMLEHFIAIDRGFCSRQLGSGGCASLDQHRRHRARALDFKARTGVWPGDLKRNPSLRSSSGFDDHPETSQEDHSNEQGRR